jgi:hypothetical protein
LGKGPHSGPGYFRNCYQKKHTSAIKIGYSAGVSVLTVDGNKNIFKRIKRICHMDNHMLLNITDNSGFKVLNSGMVSSMAMTIIRWSCGTFRSLAIRVLFGICLGLGHAEKSAKEEICRFLYGKGGEKIIRFAKGK